jgi:hypothetical protein
MNYAGLAELGWRATQTIAGKNGYDDWEKMSDVEKQILQQRWRSVSERERKRLEEIVRAATDAFACAALV